jgi:hypothetical protein
MRPLARGGIGNSGGCGVVNSVDARASAGLDHGRFFCSKESPMSPHPAPYRAAGLRARLAALAAAATVTSSIVAAVLLSFNSRAPETWLTATPELLEMTAQCDRHPARAARERCTQDIVAARLVVERNAARLAQR